jgi:hypothetical protein
MFKIGLIILSLIGLVGTTTHYAFAENNMPQPLCTGPSDTTTSPSTGPSDTTTSPSAGPSDSGSANGGSDTGSNAANAGANSISGSDYNGGGSYQSGSDTPEWMRSHGFHHHNAEGGLPGYWHHGTHSDWMDAHGGSTSYPYHMSPLERYNYEHNQERNHHLDEPFHFFDPFIRLDR